MYQNDKSLMYRNNKKLPYIRLTGIWLRKIGFEIGQQICVEIKNKRLIITVEDAPKTKK